MPMPTLRALAAALLLAALPAAQTAHAAIDSNANTDDHSINVPTSWWTFSNLTPSQLQDKIDSLGARVVEIEVDSVTAGVPSMTVRLVKDTGAYAVTGDSFVWGKSQAQLETLLANTGGRLIDLERYDAGGGDIRYAAALVPNSGATGRTWGWLPGRTKSEIASWASANNARIIDLDSVGSGSSQRWNAVLVANAGSDSKRWDWDVNQTLSQVAARLNSFNGRLVKLERQSDGKYAFVQVENTGSNFSEWWYAVGLTSLTAVNEFAGQMGGRPIDIARYTSGGATLYDAIVIDNANSATRAVRARFFERFLDANGWPIGIFEAYLERVDNHQVLVNLNSSRRADAASALKALHLLHAMKQVNAGDPLASSFTFYNYPTDQADPKDACPDPAYETSGNASQTTLEDGLDKMINVSDNRMTRGVVLRCGGFAPLNATATAAGLKNTVLRHDMGCGYLNLITGENSPTDKRNDTSAADLAAIWMGVIDGTLLPTSSTGRDEFLESGNPATGASTGLQAIINEEAASLGLSASDAASFGARVRTWGKGGSGHPRLGPQQGNQVVSIRSSAGLLSLPIGRTYSRMRLHAFASLMSDVPVPSIDGSADEAYGQAWTAAHNEMFRSAVRSALQEW